MADEFEIQFAGQATLSVDLKFNLNRLEANPTNPYEGSEINLDYLPVPSISSEFNGFSVNFHLSIGPPEALVYLNLRWYAWFSVEGNLPEDLVANDFTMINAPAIAYPFLRVFVQQLTLLSGVPPLL